MRGEWLGASGDVVRIRGEEIRVDELEFVEFGNSGTPGSLPGILFLLADGGRISGEIVRSPSDGIVIRSSLGDAVELPYSALAGVRLAEETAYPKAAELFASALESRLPGKDVLITKDTDEAKIVQGRLESLTGSGGTFVFGDRARTFQTEKVYGIVFAAGAPKQDPKDVVMTVVLADGTRFSGQLLEGDGRSLQASASFGTRLRLELDQIARLDFSSPRVTYLSELTPISEKTEGRLHEPWPVRRDRNVANGPLSLDGRVYERGLGTHSKTELAYALGGKYETLVATVGIDDAVRPRGSVIFRVLGDGKNLFDSGPLTGKDSGKKVLVEVRGVNELTLVSDYGDAADLSDYANWAGARLMGPAKR